MFLPYPALNLISTRPAQMHMKAHMQRGSGDTFKSKCNKFLTCLSVEQKDQITSSATDSSCLE